MADVATMEVAGRRALLVTRYDRLVDTSGSVERVHQEDLCQATGTPPLKKYQEDGGPSLRRVAQLLRATNDPAALDTLLRAVTLNVAIGNGDAHAKNFSLLYSQSGAIRLAPLYDLLSTQFYEDDHLAMTIGAVQRISRVTTDRIVNEANSWGLARARAAELVEGILERLPVAIERAMEDVPAVPKELVEGVSAQVRRLRSGVHTPSTSQGG